MTAQSESMSHQQHMLGNWEDREDIGRSVGTRNVCWIQKLNTILALVLRIHLRSRTVLRRHCGVEGCKRFTSTLHNE